MGRELEWIQRISDKAPRMRFSACVVIIEDLLAARIVKESATDSIGTEFMAPPTREIAAAS